MNQERNTKSQFPELEEAVLKFWTKAKVFEQSLVKEAPKGNLSRAKSRDYVFYDGPPFATGTPHYGHLVASLMKDVVPRYWTMNGHRVDRKWGWDCHGLPIENIVEKELETKSKKDIEALGVAKFNELCRSKVLGYAEAWEKTIKRLGRWVDFEHGYKTMDLDYMESIWWVFKQLWDKDLIYEGYRSMHICPRCETTLSQSEVAEGYKDVKDLSATVKFKIKPNQKIIIIDESLNKKEWDYSDKDVFVLAWTTTPWTLIGNVALAIGDDFSYTLFKKGDEYFIASDSFANNEYEKDKQNVRLMNMVYRNSLEGIEYEPLFDYYSKDENLKNRENGWKSYEAGFVTTDEGTGVVHIAPAFGEDDLNLGKEHNLPFVQHVGMDGLIKSEAGQFAGLSVKPIGDTQATDVEIIKYLAGKNLLFAKEKYEHSYPHCWRCDTPLLNYATSSWFVAVEKIKEQALKTAENINWSPEHIKDGRFGQWLEGARDWSISRQRFWASVLPIWKCEKCGELEVFGAVADLEKKSGAKITDLHKHVVDEIAFPCQCGGVMKRVPDVLDTWFDSGSMPYAQMHYPFANREKFEANFPAEFIAEGVDQTRAWFYYLHIIANGIFAKPAFKNVIVNGIVLAEDGKKMSKKLQNYPDPNEVLNHYGADALRAYLLSGPVMQAENLNFVEKGMEESLRKNIMVLWNVYKFYETYANPLSRHSRVDGSLETEQERQGIPAFAGMTNLENVLDVWINSKLNLLIDEVTKAMEAYNLPKAMRPITVFINDLSTWYLRRSRDRFKDEGADKDQALATMKYVLETLAKVMAPFMPFMAETLWQKVSGYDFQQADKSVHLENWPIATAVNEEVLKIMHSAQLACGLGLSARDLANIKVRQPLELIYLDIKDLTFQDQFIYEKEIFEIIKDEINVKRVEKISDNSARAIGRERNGIVDVDWSDGRREKYAIVKEGDNFVSLLLDLTVELIHEGWQRDLIRAINGLRKNAGLTIADRVKVCVSTTDAELIKMVNDKKAEIAADTLASEVVIDEMPVQVLIREESKINKQVLEIALIKD